MIFDSSLSASGEGSEASRERGRFCCLWPRWQNQSIPLFPVFCFTLFNCTTAKLQIGRMMTKKGGGGGGYKTQTFLDCIAAKPLRNGRSIGESSAAICLARRWWAVAAAPLPGVVLQHPHRWVQLNRCRCSIHSSSSFPLFGSHSTNHDQQHNHLTTNIQVPVAILL